jgi:elongation factor G
LNVYAASKLRNVALIGHGTSGKTSLAEALVFAAQGSKRRGSVADGNTISDFDPEEIKRQISINTSVVPCEWKGFKVNVLDTPGYFDFVGEVMASLQSVEGAVSVLCAASGLEVGAELTWEHAENFGVAQMVFINKMDRENANFAKTLEQLQNQFGNTVVPLQLPIGAADTFKGLVDLVTMKAYVFENGKAAEQPIPDELAGEAEEARAVLVEAAASADDGLTMKFLEDEPLTEEEIVHGLRLAVKERSVIPVLVGSALKDIGVTQLLDAITAYMPSAEDARVTATNANGDEIEVVPGETPGLVARVFKTLADPYVGRMTMFRVYSGTVKSDSTVYNVTRGREERVGQLFFLRGKEQIQTDAVGPGDIGVIAKLQETQTGDSLTTRDQALSLPGLELPSPTVTMAARPMEKGDEDKVFTGLTKLIEEDPTLHLERHPVTGENLVSGLGELHLEVMSARLQKKFGANVELAVPRVPYKETLRKKAHAEYRHKKQTGGRGQYGHVIIDIEPLYDGEFEFVDKIFGGAVPKQYIPAVEKGIRETMEEGVLAGYPVTNVRVTLLDGSYHSVDSSEMAFKLAASMAFKKAFMEADPVLLEPIVNMEILVPEAFMGDVMSDLNKKRGRILGMEPAGKMQRIRAQVPQAEVFRYGVDLRSITQGRGTFTAEFAAYEEVPANIQQKVIEEAKNERAS